MAEPPVPEQAPPATSARRPSASTITAVLIVAAVVGFLGGALLALTRSDTAPTSTSPATGPATPAATEGPTSAPTTTAAPTTAVDAEITLTADRASASTEDLIRLEGVLRPMVADAELRVQQSVDGIGFVDFPVTATTRSDGSFGVWVRTGRVGSNEFRMVTDVDGTQVISNAVVVQVS